MGKHFVMLDTNLQISIWNALTWDLIISFRLLHHEYDDYYSREMKMMDDFDINDIQINNTGTEICTAHMNGYT